MPLIAHGAFSSAISKPKQSEAGQDDLGICPQLIQPPGGTTYVAVLEPKQAQA